MAPHLWEIEGVICGEISKNSTKIGVILTQYQSKEKCFLSYYKYELIHYTVLRFSGIKISCGFVFVLLDWLV